MVWLKCDCVLLWLSTEAVQMLLCNVTAVIPPHVMPSSGSVSSESLSRESCFIWLTWLFCFRAKRLLPPRSHDGTICVWCNWLGSHESYWSGESTLNIPYNVELSQWGLFFFGGGVWTVCSRLQGVHNINMQLWHDWEKLWMKGPTQMCVLI